MKKPRIKRKCFIASLSSRERSFPPLERIHASFFKNRFSRLYRAIVCDVAGIFINKQTTYIYAGAVRHKTVANARVTARRSC